MIQYTDTTVFNVDAQTLVNTVNCVGVMGAGLALEFQLRFPEMEKDYVERCKAKKVEVGRPYLYKDYANPWILNFPTKNHWKYPSKIEWIEQGLRYFSANYKKGGITSIAFPKLGCSNGGLEWNTVSSIMEKYLQDLDIDVFICEDTEIEASGVEGFMVQMINDIEILAWSEKLGMRSDVKKKIVSAIPMHRFRDLRRVEGIGKQTYNDLFGFLYLLTNHSEDKKVARKLEVENLSLFEEDKNSLVQKVELIVPSNQIIELEKVENSLTEYNLELKESFDNNKSENQNDDISEYDAFHIMLPHFEKALSAEQTKDEIASKFKLPKKLVSDWLEEAEKIGRIKKLSRRPVKYVAVSSISSEQLECGFSS